MDRPRVILSAFAILAQGVKNSVHIDSADQYIELTGDVATPGSNKVYGTDGSGIRGWKDDTSSIADGSITNAKLVNQAQATIKGRAAAAGTGVPQDLSAAQVKTILAYAGTEVSNTPAGSIAATTVQAAINELDTEKQPIDADLTAIAAIVASNDDLIQRKAGSWTNRTPAQVKIDLALVKGDVGLGNVDNTSDANKPVSTAQATADGLRVAKTGDAMTGPLAMGSNKITGLANGTNAGDAVNFSQLAGGLTPTQVPIGDWNMDSTGSVIIPHTIADSTKIRIVEATIINDASSVTTMLTGLNGYVTGWGSANVTLTRITSGTFDSSAYDATSFNRGYITIFCIP